jgi:lactate permease
MWPQVYEPVGGPVLSTLLAAVPVVVLLGALGIFHLRAHVAALLGLVSALVIAVGPFGMPVGLAFATAGYGAAYGLFPIGWIILNVLFLYQLTQQRGLFTVLRESITSVTRDRRLQLLLVAFCFGAFFEGASGFGTPVAVTGAILMGLGFSPLLASGLSLIANTAPVAFGALGTPIIALQSVTGLDLLQLSAMAGRQLPFFSVIVPFWLVWAFAGLRGTLGVWPAVLVAGVSFAIPQFLVSNLHGPWLVDVISSVVSMGAVALFLRFWQPRERWGMAGVEAPPPGEAGHGHSRREVVRAWMPWIILSVVVFVWGLPQTKVFLDGIGLARFPVPGLHNVVQRVPPVVARPTAEPAVFNLNWLSATGSGILVAALIGGLAIAAMLALGFTTRYSGLDATLGLAFARTGVLYPFFGTLLGWLGVALTGSDTSSNVLFGSLQRITAEQLGLSPILMAAANSTGGVMGKMVDAQSIVVASTATRWYGHEGEILRYVFLHSLALACLMGLLVTLQAYVYPFTALVVR